MALFQADSNSGTKNHMLIYLNKDPVSIFPIYRLEPCFDALKEIFNMCWLSGFVNKNKELVAFVAATPMTLIVNNDVINCVEAHSMIIHPSLRNKRLAPLLMQDLMRKVAFFIVFCCLYKVHESWNL